MNSNLRLADPVIVQLQRPKQKRETKKQRDKIYYQLNKHKWSPNRPPNDYPAIMAHNKARYHSDNAFRKKWLLSNKRMRDLKNGNTKVCNICHTEKALADFDYARDKRNTHKRVRKTYCKQCRSEINRRAYERRKRDTSRVY